MRVMSFVIAVIVMATTSGSFAGTETFHLPKRENQHGYNKLIFINATNGNEFCEEEGYNKLIGGSIYCGEDESYYVTYNWSQQRWISKATGSKNQCYPLYASMICSD